MAVVVRVFGTALLGLLGEGWWWVSGGGWTFFRIYLSFSSRRLWRSLLLMMVVMRMTTTERERSPTSSPSTSPRVGLLLVFVVRALGVVIVGGGVAILHIRYEIPKGSGGVVVSN